MFRRNFIIVSLTLLAVLSIAFIFLPNKVVEISKSQIEQGLSNNLPYVVDRGIVSVTVHEATVGLSDSGQIQLLAEFDAKGLTLEGVGSAMVNSVVRYERGQFYLSDLVHKNVQFDLSANSADTVSEVRSTFENILRRETEEATVSGDANAIAKLSEQNNYLESELERDALNALDDFLGTFPVYDLERADGSLRFATLALDNVEVTSDKVLVTLSFQTLIIRLAGLVGTALVVLVVVFGPIIPHFRRST